MKLGLFTLLYMQEPLEEALDRAKALGCEAVEIACGGYVGKHHCNPAELLEDAEKLRAFQHAIERRGLQLSALSCHANPVHPNTTVAREHASDMREAINLAGRMGVPCVVLFSGCPGGSPGACDPNWITSPWPDEFHEMYNWQWKEVLIPFWQDMAAWARDHGVRKLCLEMAPSWSVYNPATLLQLRDAAGEEIGANLDPSHLFYQGIDPVAATHALGPAVYYVHAKDADVNRHLAAVNGLFDTHPYSQVSQRAWNYRTVGYGHGHEFWKEFVTALRAIGYDYVMSIEHEDGFMSLDEGIRKATEFLREIIMIEAADKPWFDRGK